MDPTGLRWLNSPLIDVAVPEGVDEWQADLTVPEDWPESQRNKSRHVSVPGRVFEIGSNTPAAGLMLRTACSGSERTDSDGRFELDCPDEADLELVLGSSKQQPYTTVGLKQPGATRVVLQAGRVLSPELPLNIGVRRGPARELRLRDEAGRPLAGARVVAPPVAGERKRITTYGPAWETSLTGEVRVLGDGAGHHLIFVLAPARGWLIVDEIEIREDGPLDLVLPINGRLRLLGTPPWSLEPAEGSSWFVSSIEFPRYGLFSGVAGAEEWSVPPGRWKLRDNSGSSWVVDVEPGEVVSVPPGP